MIDVFRLAIMWLCCAILAAASVIACCVLLCRVCGVLALRLRPAALALLGVCAACATIFAARKGCITYPRTDPTVAYLTDTGSYLSNDVVHVSFSRFPAVPPTAELFVDRRSVDSASDDDWISVLATTFAEVDVPFDFQFAGATNYDWIVYTTWIPGPSVVTNGVWHAFWASDTNKVHILPIGTKVRDGERIINTLREDAE